MKTLLILIFTIVTLHANTHQQVDINLTADFYIQKQNKQSQLQTYKYEFSIYHDMNADFNKKSYCVFNKERIRFSNTVNKPKYKMCIYQDGSINIYSLSESFRYAPAKRFKVVIENINFQIIDKSDKKLCEANVSTYDELNQKINICLSTKI